MTVYDLNRDQLQELKQHYYAEKTGEDLSYEELAFIDDYVSDEEVYDYYAGTVFSPDDFLSSAGEDEPERQSLSDKIGEAEEYLNSLRVYRIIFDNPGLSTTEEKVRDGVLNAIHFLESARRAALDLRY